MKFIHLSDLHIGKRVNEFSMIDEQNYILMKIINIIDDEKPDCILIAGDIYDKSVPPTEAVQIFDDFLVRIADRNIKVFIVSGNHDSPERVAFGSRIMNRSGIFISPAYNGTTTPVTLTDKYGDTDIFMLPFIKPAYVRKYFPETEIESYSDAVKAAVGCMNLNPENRTVLVAHQFVTGAMRCESEDISVGGIDNVDADIFNAFDYAAFGHIHSPQRISNTVVYCGSPLKYSFSEAAHEKSVTVAELLEKGNVQIKKIPLVPRRDMREIRGSYDEITLRDNYSDTKTDDYMHITLTDEEDIPDAIGKLRVIYPNLMKLNYDNKRTRTNSSISGTVSAKQIYPSDLFKEFYEKQNNQPMTPEQEKFASELIEKIWGNQ